MPRTPDQSASSALRTTSVYQRSKSTDILVMSFTKSCCSSTVSFIRMAPKYPGDQSWHARAELRGLARERSRRGGVLCRDRVDLGQQHLQELFLGHRAVQLTFPENHALAATAGHADVGVPGFGRTVDDAAHDRNRDRNLERSDVRLDRLDRRHHVVLEPAARRARDQGRALVADGKGLQDLVCDPDL